MRHTAPHTRGDRVSALLDVSALSATELPWLELVMEVLFELPIRRPDGTALTHQEVVAGLARDTLDQICSLGARARAGWSHFSGAPR